MTLNKVIIVLRLASGSETRVDVRTLLLDQVLSSLLRLPCSGLDLLELLLKPSIVLHLLELFGERLAFIRRAAGVLVKNDMEAWDEPN